MEGRGLLKPQIWIDGDPIVPHSLWRNGAKSLGEGGLTLSLPHPLLVPAAAADRGKGRPGLAFKSS